MLPTDPKERKDIPITTGVLDYFPAAIAEIARVSKVGNDQHNPNQPLHWAREKSTDHADCISRHLLERGTVDSDGQRHSAKLAWRALALLQTELETAQEPTRREVLAIDIQAGKIIEYDPAKGMPTNLRSKCLSTHMPGSGRTYTCNMPPGHEGKHRQFRDSESTSTDILIEKEW